MLGNQKEALNYLIRELIEADEPEALLATLLRVAQRMSYHSIRQATPDECMRWERLADAIKRVQERLGADEID